MAKLEPVRFDDFTLKKAVIKDNSVVAEFEENRIIDDQAKVIQHRIEADYHPHPDLIEYRNKLREFLMKAYSMDKGHEMAIKYLKGEQKKIAEESLIELYDILEVTGVSISGDDQLKGVVISGKIKSFNGAKCAMNTPRIVYSSEKLGYEQDVESIVELITREVYKYIFEGKKAQQDLFDEAKEPEMHTESALQ